MLRYTAQPMRLSRLLPMGGVAIALAGVVIAAFTGWLGPLATCGADGAAVCMHWPGFAAAATWLAFMSVIAALVVFQARDWRRPCVARREVALLLALLATALIERTWRIDLAEIGYDEASAASLIAA